MTTIDVREAPPRYRPGWFRRLCWFTTGADSGVLCLPDLPESERMRFAAIGATMLIITGLGVLSGGMAFYQIFYPGENEFEFIGTPWRLAISCLFAAAWTLALYNMQRFRIFGSHRDSTKVRLGLPDFLNMLPGLVFSCVIGLAVATPLQIFVFDKEIDTQLVVERQEKLAGALAAVDRRFPRSLIRAKEIVDTPVLGGRSGKARDGQCETAAVFDEATMATDLKRLQRCLELYGGRIQAVEMAVRVGHGSDATLVPLAASAQEALPALLRQRDTLEAVQIVMQEPGLLRRAALAYEVDPLLSWVLLLAVIFVQAAPVLVCSMSVRGPYDDLVAIASREKLAEEGIEPGVVYLFPETGGALAVDRYHRAKEAERRTRKALTEQRRQLRRERLEDFRRRLDLID